MRIRGGATVAARRGVIVAAEGPAAAHLLGERLESAPSAAAEGVGTCCLYFTCTPGLFDPLQLLLLAPNGLSIIIARKIGCSLLLQAYMLPVDAARIHVVFAPAISLVPRSAHHVAQWACRSLHQQRTSCHRNADRLAFARTRHIGLAERSAVCT